jgi:hypothetical protein
VQRRKAKYCCGENFIMLAHEKKKYRDTGGRIFTEHPKHWPVSYEQPNIKWFPASNRLIGLVRANLDKFVLPPAIVRKAAWRE